MDRGSLPWLRQVADAEHNLVYIKHLHSSLREGAVNLPNHFKITLYVKKKRLEKVFNL